MNSNDDDQLLNCFICFQKVRRAKMCPYCSKMGCYECLKMWFDSSRMECPYCRQQATLNSFADCGRFVDQLKQKLICDDDKPKLKDLCPSHRIQMRYYCQTCKSPFCPDCSTFQDVHKGHKISLINKIHQSHKDKIHQQLNGFYLKSKQYRKNGTIIKTKIQQLAEQKKNKTLFLQLYLRQRLHELDKQFHEKQSLILSKLQSNQQQKQLLMSLKQTLVGDISKFSQIEIVTKSDEMVEFINNLCNRKLDKQLVDNNDLLVNDIEPQFVMFTYEMKDFSTLGYDIVYSESYFLNGIQWRIKTYPRGNGQAKDNHLSVFLQMTNAFESKKEYEYRIELINQFDQKGSLIRQYISMFEIGECWGYNQFIELDLLTSGYIDDDKLIFKFYIRPKNYKNQAIDQQNYIKSIEEKIKDIQKQILIKSDTSIKSNNNLNRFDSIINQLSNKRGQIKSQLLINNIVQKEITEAGRAAMMRNLAQDQ